MSAASKRPPCLFHMVHHASDYSLVPTDMTKSPLEQQLEIVATLAAELPFEAEPAAYLAVLEQEAD